jgi:hypothetical protein
MLILDPNLKQSPGHHLGDSVALDTAAFAHLIKSKVAVGDPNQVDTLRFLPDVAWVLPTALKHISINPKTDNPTEPEFDMPEVGHTVYGHKPVIRRPGVVAVRKQFEGSVAGEKEIGYIDNSTTVPLISTTGESVTKQRNNLPVHHLTPASDPSGQSDPDIPRYAIWDETIGTPQYSPFQTAQLQDGSNPAAGHYYISDYRETIQYVTDGSTSPEKTATKSVPVVVKATRYPHLVAQDFNTEPFYYFPGYQFVEHLHIEHGTDLLFESSGEYSWYQNQLSRLHGKKDEDARLAHAYGLEQNVINSPFSGNEALRNYPSASPTANTKFTNGIEMAQRVSRATDAHYSPIWHPFNKPSTALPMPNLFATQIKYKYTLRPLLGVLVNPEGKDTRNPERNFQYSLDDIYIRPKNKDTQMEFTNEELQRTAEGKLPPNMENIQNASEQKHISTRLELVVVTLDQEELEQLEDSKMSIVTTQPQTKHHTMTKNTDTQGQRIIEDSFEDRPSGYLRNYFVCGRQCEAIKKNMRYDLATFVDSTSGLSVPAVFSVQYSYDKQRRTNHGVSSESTSTHLIRNFYGVVPPELHQQGIHLLATGFKLRSQEVTGLSVGQKSRAICFNVRATADSFTYQDPFNLDAAKTPTDVIISVFMEMFQLFMFSLGYIYRTVTYPNVDEAKC